MYKKEHSCFHVSCAKCKSFPSLSLSLMCDPPYLLCRSGTCMQRNVGKSHWRSVISRMLASYCTVRYYGVNYSTGRVRGCMQRRRTTAVCKSTVHRYSTEQRAAQPSSQADRTERHSTNFFFVQYYRTFHFPIKILC